MIEIEDSFLPEKDFAKLQKYCAENDFQIVQTGDKSFSVLETPDYLEKALQKEGYEIVLTFVRNAWKDFDNTWRRHADNIINGRKTDLASVLYINDEKEFEETGTAFWEHCHYGDSLPEDISEDEFNRLLFEDSENDDRWEMIRYVNARPNRLLTYKSNDFHSKFPKVIETGIRKVAVCFYAKIYDSKPD